ncbi:MAG TPA: hypothetical protein VLB73_03100 [Patescibacteria group bacterium]|nr:hypothetical protein [Patescibacteria group bacterium]
MKKLLTLLDEHLLKWLTIFTLTFVMLYPKLPSIHIVRTWVYIRLEDFSIAALVVIFLIQLIRRKVRLPLPVGIPLGIYWLAGLASLLVCLVFVGPHLVGFFPHLAILEYGRRIEYMILFFIAFSTIRSMKDVRDYMIGLCIALSAVVLYGFGQRFYLVFWGLFPKFFEQYAFCFPSFQTGNEEFAKGLALCLPAEARITSTFGGHYDLAAFLVVVLPILLGIFAAVRKIWIKIGVGVLFVTSLMLLIFTASRVSFTAYLVGAIFSLILLKKKLLIIPVVIISILCLVIFSGSTAKRFLQTFRIVNVVTNNQGQVVGLADNNLPDSLKKKISKNDSVIVEAPPPTQNLPTGSSFITLSQTAVATKGAYVKAAIPTSEAQRLKLANGGLEISTVSGNFLIQKALVYDISFTTRFQAEWPNAWAAFMSDPPFGKGYSTITLATDNDYLRLLGESGFVGFAAFALIFLVLAIFLKESIAESSGMTKFFALGLAGGVVGLILNAGLIDVFEASKVAEPLWILLGVAVGGLSLTFAKRIDYTTRIKKVLSSHIFLLLMLGILAFVMFGGGLANFFVADDFIWLKWAATAHPMDLLTYFTDAQGSIYRPIAKIIMFLMYSVFAFQPGGYHAVGLFVHFFIAVGLYMLGLLIFKKKLWAWLLAGMYVILPIHGEVLFWISTISISWSTLFIVYSLVAYTYWREKKSNVLYIVSLLLGILSLFTYEMGVMLPFLLLLTDVLILEKKLTKRVIVSIAPFLLATTAYLYVRAHSNVAGIGGDYSYNTIHLIPNFIANYANYILASLVGEKIIAWQYLLRLGLKTHAFSTTVGLVVGVGILGAICLTFWKKVNKELLRNVLYGFLFAFIGLLPFLGFGNMSERYGYLGSFGFVFVLIAVAQYVLQKRKAMYIKVVLAIVLTAFFLYAKVAINNELLQWKKASMITYNTLAYFRVVKEFLPSGATLYVSHLPTKYGNAWIFPVGFKEGLWFVYRDDSIKIVKTQNVDESLTIKTPHAGPIRAKEYTFDFDNNGNLLEY